MLNNATMEGGGAPAAYALSGGTLKPHVGHKVTLTGTVEDSAAGASKAGAPPEPAGTSGKAGAMPNLSVTSINHVAPTCTP